MGAFTGRAMIGALLLALGAGCFETDGVLIDVDARQPFERGVTDAAVDGALDATPDAAPTPDAEPDAAVSSDAGLVDGGPDGSRDGALIDEGVPPGGPRVCVCESFMAQGEAWVSGGLAVQDETGAAGGLIVDGRFTSGARALGINAPITADEIVHRGSIQQGDALTTTGDLVVGGDVAVDGDLRVGGVLRQPEGSTVEATGQTTIGERRFEVVPFDWPCDCALRFDPVPATPDDRPGIGLNSDELSNLQVDRVVELHAGRYVFDAIGGPGGLTVRATGAVELAIRGPVQVDGGLTVTLAADASLRMLVDDDLIVSGVTRIGDPERPDASELIVRGRSITVSAPFEFSGRLLAPRATLGTSLPLDWPAILLLENVSAAADLRVR